MTQKVGIPLNLNEESVWDYPRPPRVEPIRNRLRVVFHGIGLAETMHGQRVLETSHPPVYYFPTDDVRIEHLLAVSATSFCEWKGIAHYFDVHVDGKRVTRAAWAYPDPTPEFIAIKNYIAFYGHLMDACFVGDELARPQPGSFYGGWITNNIIGPFKREPGTARW
jgi:uncharacterized protein (DUF427 family)